METLCGASICHAPFHCCTKYAYAACAQTMVEGVGGQKACTTFASYGKVARPFCATPEVHCTVTWQIIWIFPPLQTQQADNIFHLPSCASSLSPSLSVSFWLFLALPLLKYLNILFVCLLIFTICIARVVLSTNCSPVCSTFSVRPFQSLAPHAPRTRPQHLHCPDCICAYLQPNNYPP